ncbi:acyl-homoserine-lactone synthase [Roseitranquillus sediminis]|uniref:acyl-homoserine-lactone synthase n=1 Tax=Roseitranquillus sediminis TaxID=2809051 RepID=UPI001D0CC121|nr:acyl-homoserine-lactone synthase [Roseitranquillus sediminis]MBM9596348.1 N-acyl-L-homoserine lactone synthetase [Roseitranquillus sediminis]
MQTTTLSFENMHNYGDLFANLLRARRQSFIVQNEWDLPEAMGMEYDQYDTPASRWVAVHDFGKVLGGMRLTPTTARCGIYSYMIRDAQKGLLPSIPEDLLDCEAPVAPHIWEVTRGFVAHDVPANIRRSVHAQMVVQLSTAAREFGASQMLALLPANWTRWARRCGLAMSAGGRVMVMDGIRYQVVSMDFSRRLH